MEHKEMYLNTTPDSNDIWKELGGNYENAEQTINELVDNAVSNLIGNAVKAKKIQITLEETNDIDQAIIIYIEDSGLGIANAEQAFTLGKAGTDSVLNEHGFGLLQALSAANEKNDSWDVYKRSSDNRAKKEIMHIMAPYVIGKQPYEVLSDSEWPGHEWGNTLVKVRCDFKLFQTLLPVEESVRSAIQFDFELVADRIYEDLGFSYSNLLKEKEFEMILVIKRYDGSRAEHKITPILPVWKEVVKNCNNNLNLILTYGQIEKLPERIRFNNDTSSRYYKANLTSSGVELRINGRAMEYNKFEEIFGIKNHPHYNSLLVQVDIVSNSRELLPATRTAKNGFRVGDEQLQKIYKYIRKMIPTNKKKAVKPISISEKDKKNKLARLIQEDYDTNDFHLEIEPVVSKEVAVFKQILNGEYPRIDILVNMPEKVTIIEAKKNTASVQDLYQLLMYCDGYYLDNGKMPDEAILVAKDFPAGLRRVQGYLNHKNNGLYPEIICKYWNDYKENFEDAVIDEKKLKGIL